MTNTKKRIYRVENEIGQVLSGHITYTLAHSAMLKYEAYAARSIVGLFPTSLFSVTRWNGKSWQKVAV